MVVFLSETKNRKRVIDVVMKQIQFDGNVVVEPDGRAGGLAMFWKQEVKVRGVYTSECSIEIKIYDEEVRDEWWCIGLYASTDDGIRRGQWEFLEERMKRNGLVDIHFEGNPWTWCNQWENEGEIKQRLDRCLSSVGWFQMFGEATCKHVENEASDHAMLVLTTIPEQKKVRKRFVFDQKWAQNQETEVVVKNAWEKPQVGSRMFKITRKIRECRIALLSWNRMHQQNTATLIREIKKKIQELKESNDKGKRGKMVEMKLKLSSAYKAEEIFWAQKARSRWLKEGDKNTAYFHACVKTRRKRNKITSLQKGNGEWCKDNQQIVQEICRYYEEMYTTSQPKNIEEVLEGVPVSITSRLNQSLIQPVEENEVRAAVFSMHPNKALGPDGMSPLFFQRYWHTIKNDVVSAIQSFLSNGHLLKSINETSITLIPKVDNPISLANYRPISLCNVLYRIIAKILANRMKRVIALCISYSQSAFVPGRQIVDNVILAHEIMHFLKSKRKGNTAFMTLKLDMSKAYDRIEWKFVGRMMLKMGFCPIFVRWIMNCMSSVTYSFNVNGERVGYVKPSRGIRQGDPLSPYLFLCCSEGLYNLMAKAIENRKITGLKVSRSGPVLSHLFFADDSLFCCKVHPQEASVMKGILAKYELASGQCINYDKSAAYFSRNCSRQQRRQTCEQLNNIKEANNGKYLGLPLVITGSKKEVFAYIVDKAKSKMQGWKHNLLSYAGKEVLLKSIVMALPTYIMSCCRLPKGLCKEICGYMAKFWRGQNEGERKMQWISWEKITQVKGSGGLGFRDLEHFNSALLAKQLWRILMQPDSLVSGVLAAKYKVSQTGWEGEAPKNASWVWRSIASSSSVLQKGMWKRVGDGTSINIWRDKWIMESPTGKITTRKHPDCRIQLVAELIKERKWNKELIEGTFSKGEASQIMQIPLSLFPRQDTIYWKYSKSGIYSVKSGYAVKKEEIGKRSKEVQGGEGTSYAQNSDKADRNRIPFVQMLWGRRENSGTYDFLLQNGGTYMEVGPYEGKYRDHRSIIEIANNEWLEFQEEQTEQELKHRTGTRHQLLNHQWRPPDIGIVRINTDAAVPIKLAGAGLGMVARDSHGNLVEARGIRKYSRCGAELEEADAIRQGLVMAKEAGWREIEVQSDCKAVIERIHTKGREEAPIGTILEDIKQLCGMFQCCTFLFINRDGNRCAHQMAQFATKLVFNVIWKQSFPLWLKESIQEDNRMNIHFCT
ncbi:uncharacterized protein [Coffea arabica]|uniref:Reverse transcriptase domain-containing protein n=1 Tax=Coffea arabica TaxID=13443 RepID=A0ABM4WPN2_COFAR